MSTENERALDFYSKYADLYSLRNKKDYTTPQGLKEAKAHQDFIRKTVEGLPHSAKMFEIGSADGRDAKLINSLGYNIQVSDAVDSFMDMLTAEGFSPVKFNVVTDDFSDTYDYILANAVLVHLTKNEVKTVVQKIHAALKQNGIFVLSLKQRLGGGEEWKANIDGASGKRYFSYWDIDEAKTMLEAAGFEIIWARQVGGIRACWLELIVKKK